MGILLLPGVIFSVQIDQTFIFTSTKNREFPVRSLLGLDDLKKKKKKKGYVLKPTNAYFPGSVSVQNSAQSPKRFSFFCFIWKTNLGVSFGVKRRKPVGKCLQAGPPHRPHLPPGPAPDWWVRDLTQIRHPRGPQHRARPKSWTFWLSAVAAHSPPPPSRYSFYSWS